VQHHPCPCQRSAGECHDKAVIAAGQARILREIFHREEDALLADARAASWRRARRAAQQTRRLRCRRS
jgi:hypothetical protein